MGVVRSLTCQHGVDRAGEPFHTISPGSGRPGSHGIMKSLTQELWMNVPARRGIVSIHDEVERLVAESGVQEGLVLVNTTKIGSPAFSARVPPQR